MNDPYFLHLFIEEPIYLVPEKNSASTSTSLLPEKLVESSTAMTTDPIIAKSPVITEALILVSDANHETIAPDDKEFLTKIINAVQLEIEKVIIVNLHGIDTPNPGYIAHYHTEKVLDFSRNGISGSDINYDPQQINNQQWVVAHTLQEISLDANKKKMLWKALQNMFLK